MDTWLALVGFSFVSAVTPGPNNVLLWVSGAVFGVRRTLRHVLGTGLGIGAIAVVVAVGSGAVVALVPGLATVMKLAGSAYLVVLAIQVLRMDGLRRVEQARPFGILAAAGFQLLNPKAWVFAFGAMSTFRLPDLPPLASELAVALTMAIVVLPASAIWAVAGGAIERLVTSPLARRAVGIGLAALLLATIALVWM